jgi:predicted nuclease of predicted toxin-antitoxin system
VRFLVDNQLPIALARFLAARGCDCDHVTDLSLGSASDSVIWHYAHQNGLIVISKDEDFLYLATGPEDKARLVWVRLSNCRNHVLLANFDRSWPRIEALLNAGDRVIGLR